MEKNVNTIKMQDRRRSNRRCEAIWVKKIRNTKIKKETHNNVQIEKNTKKQIQMKNVCKTNTNKKCA